ncbi:MAG: tail fiber domain-containing protein [Pyrinomonadaceae bacterium MAG19_C2-C3]|nr:tail fiber domain-containing protein [Pyrinomonadaceae bacterium MAG19_C2-C3]
MTNQRHSFFAAIVFCALAFFGATVQAQTSGFTYQGRFSDSTVAQPTNGTYEMEFALFDAATGGTQIGMEIDNPNVQVTNGIFTVQLDFGAAAFADGGARFLQISARRNSNEACITLTPRQPITSAPYAIRSQNAATAETATNATQLGGVNANQFIQEGDTRLSDSRPSSSVNFSTAQLSGVVPINRGGTGSATQNFVDLTTAQTIAGNKTFSGTLSGGTVNAVTQFNISGNRVLGVSGITSLLSNTFVGISTGNSSSINNTFVGFRAGDAATNGGNNSFFGASAGSLNTTGGANSFFGRDAGNTNVSGNSNTIISHDADVGSGNLSFATAVGAGAVVSTSNTIQLGRTTGNDRVLIPGQLSSTGQIIAGGGIALNATDIRLFGATDTNHIFSYEAGFNGILSRSFEFQWRRFNNGGNTLMILANNGVLTTIGGFQQSSDARYKTDVQTFGNALDTIRRLRGVTFNWKPELQKDSRLQIGFIAQEVEAVLPELVTTDENGYKSVSYANAVPVLVEAVKQQQEQIEQFQNQIKQHQLVIDGLRKLVCSQNPQAEVCQQGDK